MLLAALAQVRKIIPQLNGRLFLSFLELKNSTSFCMEKKFTLVTDHQPLLTILGPKTAIPPLAAAHM